MKRLVILFLMLVLPLQFSYAAASAYCENEPITSAEHFGHHDHGAAPTGAATGGDEKSANHVDCGICHLGCAKLLKADPTVGLHETALTVVVPYLLSVAQHQPSPLHRPPIEPLA